MNECRDCDETENLISCDIKAKEVKLCRKHAKKEGLLIN